MPIPISAIENTAEDLMAKATIEIPQDYLDGLTAAADTEKGDLASFVLQAMLDNYQAAKEDRRAMCGDTGTPRWYVKLSNEAQVEGGMIAAYRYPRTSRARLIPEPHFAPVRTTPSRCAGPKSHRQRL